MPEVLGGRELAAVTEVFQMFETWPLAGRMAADRLLPAMKTLGLSPAEWEIVELHSEYGASGFISLPDFVAIFTEKMNSSFESDDFTLKAIFRAIKGTEPYSPAKTAPIRSYDNYELSFQVLSTSVRPSWKTRRHGGRLALAGIGVNKLEYTGIGRDMLE